MIEVRQEPGGWRWTFICTAGRALVWSPELYPTDHEAARAAKVYRREFFSVAIPVDGCGVRAA